MSYKMAILIRSDIKMSKGKVLAQVSHAVVKATIKAYTATTLFYKWQNDGEKIVILKVSNEKTLDTIINIAERKNIKNGVVIDAGLTEVSPGTKTVGFIGPDCDYKVDKLVGQLKLY
jgi:PTH2 family peptidyl-tRNA hydrolase